MGFCYGYNRAERLEHYHTGRELVIMLVRPREPRRQPAARHRPRRPTARIPVVMEERLMQIGDWLKVNGEAIYGTRPWTTRQQWSAGEVPEGRVQQGVRDRLRRHEARPRSRAPGKASIEAFFTAKGKDVYAILPRWPGRRFTVKDAGGLE